MGRHPSKLREEARQYYLTGEILSVAEIARRLKLKPHTVGQWRKAEAWDALRLKIERRAAEQLVEKLASERVSLNTQHFKLWNAIVGKLFASLTLEGASSAAVRDLDRMASILERAQKGQRLARGLSLDGETEEQIRADAQATERAMVDLFVDVIKSEVADELLRERIAERVLARLPLDEELTADGA